MGGWPTVTGDGWNEESFDWIETITKFRTIGYSINYLIDFYIMADLKNSTYRTIYVVITISSITFTYVGYLCLYLYTLIMLA